MSELVCIVCPMGCRMTVEKDQAAVLVQGNSCPRGERYAIEEVTAPRRVLTGVVRVEGRTRPLPVKTAAPIPKEKLWMAMAELKRIRCKPPLRIGATITENLAETGIALIATGNID